MLFGDSAGGAVLATFIMMQYRAPGWLFPLFVAFVGYLMVSTIKYPEFKGHGEKLRSAPVVITILIVAVLLYFRPESWLFAPFFGFMLLGLVNIFFTQKK